MTPNRAETIGLEALTFVASLPERLDTFLIVSGMDAVTLRARAAEYEVLRAVLDFLLADDSLVMAFCDQHALAARDIHLAHRTLEDVQGVANYEN
jgi:hypothetical protein